LRILLVSHYSLPHAGGIEFVLDEMARRLSRRGHQVRVLTSDAGQADRTPEEADPSRVFVRAVNVLEGLGIPYPLFDPLALRKELARAVSWADVVHAHGLLYMSSVMAVRLARRFRTRVVVTEHAGTVHYPDPVRSSLQRLAFAVVGSFCVTRADAVTVLNERVARQVRPWLPVETPLARVVNGVDTERFRPAPIDERDRLRARWELTAPTALFVGRLEPRKGIDLAVEAAAGGFPLLVCGRGAHCHRPPGVRWLGALDRVTLASLYRAADVLVLPSAGEGFSLAVQEALASGLPVVVTDDAVNREYLDETVAVFTPRCATTIRERVRSLLDDTERRAAMARAAREWAETHFDWDRCVSTYLRLYREP
jgi:glycosyltransferase involved in cell wall biosynthesis